MTEGEAGKKEFYFLENLKSFHSSFHSLLFQTRDFPELPSISILVYLDPRFTSRPSAKMSPPNPTIVDRFFAQNQYPILMTTFAAQVLHHQYIRKTQPAFELSGSAVKTSSFPRPLRAGLAWALVFTGLLTKITLSKQAVRDHTDPLITHSSLKTPWKRVSEDSS